MTWKRWRKVVGLVALVLGVWALVSMGVFMGAEDVPVDTPGGWVPAWVGVEYWAGFAALIFLIATGYRKIGMIREDESGWPNLISIVAWVFAQSLIFLYIGEFVPLRAWSKPDYFALVILQPLVDWVDLLAIIKNKICSGDTKAVLSLAKGAGVLTAIGIVALGFLWFEVRTAKPYYVFAEKGIYIDVAGGENYYIRSPQDMEQVLGFVKDDAPYYGLTVVLVYKDKQGYRSRRTWYPDIPALNREPEGEIYLVEDLENLTILATAHY